MFAKVVNGVVAEWPIPSLAPLFPNTSFPSPMTEDSLPEGYVMVGVIPQPTSGPNQKVVPGGPVQQGGKWVQSWTVLDMEPQEVSERDTARANDVRAERNHRLAECDWTQVADAPVDKAAWAAYRQALRDVTNQAGFPHNTDWPQEPL
jgi:hypothetical protein